MATNVTKHDPLHCIQSLLQRVTQATYIRTLLPLMLFSSFTGNVTHLKVCSGFLIYIMETQQTKVIRRVNMMSKTEERDGNFTSVQCCGYRVYDYSLQPLAKSWCSELNLLGWFSEWSNQGVIETDSPKVNVYHYHISIEAQKRDTHHLTLFFNAQQYLPCLYC